ncbi:MAG: CPBP family intramembrane glutamic endopeptidase [Pseudomonadota bacterium]
MQTGPFNTPITLASRPAMAVFWAMVAPSALTMAVVFLTNFVSNNWASAQFTSQGTMAGQSLLTSIGFLICFAAMSIWSERIGAGAFAGAIRVSPDWVGIAALTGPILFSGTTFLLSLIVSADGTWWLRPEVADTLPPITEITILMVIFAVVLVPLVEEVAFRGIGLGCLLARGWDPALGVLITTIGFTALHSSYSPLGLIPIFVTGLYLGALRVLSGSVAASLIAHMSANFVIMLGALLAGI